MLVDRIMIDLKFFFVVFLYLKNLRGGTSLMLQWSRLCLPMQWVWVQYLARELDPTSYNYEFSCCNLDL